MSFPLAVAEAAAREAGARLKEAFGQAVAVEKKGAVDLVTEMDRSAERLIVERLRAAFPDDPVIAEESGGSSPGEGRRWLVDPLDGTTNYAHGHPQFSVSIARANGQEVELGVIYDPLREEMFAAARGQGATLGGRPIRVSTASALDDAMVATGFPYDRRERADFYMPFYRAAVVTTQGVRRAGSAALDLAWVACGRLDAYFEFGIKPWDIAAGTLLVREAGGRVSDMRDAPLDLAGGSVLASNGRLHPLMVEMLSRAWPRPSPP